MEALPSEADFVVYGCLDEQWAWKQFGGLTLDEAKAKFLENPLRHQEDFMWMGAPAFAFYFPVLDEYLRSVPDREAPEDDSHAGIIGYGIKFQYEQKQVDALRPLIPAVLALAEYVLANLHRFGRDEEDQQRVAREWTEMVARVRSTAAG